MSEERDMTRDDRTQEFVKMINDKIKNTLGRTNGNASVFLVLSELKNEIIKKWPESFQNATKPTQNELDELAAAQFGIPWE